MQGWGADGGRQGSISFDPVRQSCLSVQEDDMPLTYLLRLSVGALIPSYVYREPIQWLGGAIQFSRISRNSDLLPSAK